MSGALRFNAMHFMPYVHLPENHKEYKSLWVSFPNKYFDPERGHALYERYLSELVLADRLGFDAIVVNEHHNTVYSMMATPNLIAAALVPQVKNARICVWGTPPNFMLPNRLAEEYAILDVMSKGRLEIALPLGTGMEYWSDPVNPATAREKFKESSKIMLQAWTEDGPTTHYGTHYKGKLQHQGGFTYPRFPSYQDDRSPDNPASKNAVKFLIGSDEPVLFGKLYILYRGRLIRTLR